MTGARDTVRSAMNSAGTMVLGDPQLLLLNPDPMVPRRARPRNPPRDHCSRSDRSAAVAGGADAAACPSGSTAHEPGRSARRARLSPDRPARASCSTTRRSPASRSGSPDARAGTLLAGGRGGAAPDGVEEERQEGRGQGRRYEHGRCRWAEVRRVPPGDELQRRAEARAAFACASSWSRKCCVQISENGRT